MAEKTNVTEGTAKKIDWEEKVDLMIPRDPSNPKDTSVTIVHNGNNYQIMRGVPVKVPRKVAQVYWDSEAQKAKAYNYAAAAENAAKKESALH